MTEKKVVNCTICLDDIEDESWFLPCTHVFHNDCINNWIKEKPICPICKIPIYVSTPEQLEIYNYNQRLREQREIADAQFFQQLSSGAFDNNIQQPSQQGVLRNFNPILDVINNQRNNNLDNVEIAMMNIGSVIQIFDTIINGQLVPDEIDHIPISNNNEHESNSYSNIESHNSNPNLNDNGDNV